MSSIETLTNNNTKSSNESTAELGTIQCSYLELSLQPCRSVFAGERLLAVQALGLLMKLDSELMKARADWNQDRFRRVMRARSRATLRLRRRWSELKPQPAMALGTLRRRYHANLAGSLYQAKE
jgi:hypothetical protein